MNFASVEMIANAILYEGYILYPYRGSSTKNQQRWNFGTLYPRNYAQAQRPHAPYQMITECLAEAAAEARLDIRIRFLQLVEADSQAGQEWQQGIERKQDFSGLDISSLVGKTTKLVFRVDAGDTATNARELAGELDLTVSLLPEGLFKLRLQLQNVTDVAQPLSDRNRALLQSFTSAHALLGIEGGDFVSLLDPPEKFQFAVRGCQNEGVFPILVGPEGQRSMMLCSPITLYDYPQVAPESAGDFFDSTEMDEMLALRVLTLTDDEKREMLQDDRSRKILERTESLPAEQLIKVHGAIRGLRRVPEEGS